MTGFCEIHEHILANNAVVIGISPDTIERQRSFTEATNAPFELGSDPSGDIRRLYQVKRRLGLGTSRITYVINRAGVIRGAFHNEISMNSHARNALSIVTELT